MKDINFLIPLGLIVSELINNTLKHAYPEPCDKNVSLSIVNKANNLTITYKDNGIGFNKKQLNPENKLKSFGMKIIHSLAKQLNGRVHFYNEDGALVEINIKTNSNKTYK